MNAAYLTSRIVEGLLMIAGGIFILSPATEAYRTQIYDKIHIYFFIAGALLFYVLLYRTCLAPRFLSVWGAVATLVLLLITIIRLIGFDHALFGVLPVPIIVNEIVLAVWLMVKGFNKS